MIFTPKMCLSSKLYFYHSGKETRIGPNQAIHQNSKNTKVLSQQLVLQLFVALMVESWSIVISSWERGRHGTEKALELLTQPSWARISVLPKIISHTRFLTSCQVLLTQWSLVNPPQNSSWELIVTISKMLCNQEMGLALDTYHWKYPMSNSTSMNVLAANSS